MKLRPIMVIVPHPTPTQSTLVLQIEGLFCVSTGKTKSRFQNLNTPPNPNTNSLTEQSNSYTSD